MALSLAEALGVLARAGLTSPEQVAAEQQRREANALRGIAALRNMGYQDQQIFSMPSQQVQGYGEPGANPMNLAGGYQLLGPAVSLAATAAQYKLGRGDLARQYANDLANRDVQASQQYARPFNVVGAFDYAGRTGQTLPIGAAGPLQTVRTEVATPKYDADTFLNNYLKEKQEVSVPGVPQYARGGAQMLDEPVMGIGMMSGQPQFIAGEAGPEKAEFTPMASLNDMKKSRTEGFREYARGGSALFSGAGAKAIKSALAKRKQDASTGKSRAASQQANADALRGLDPSTDASGPGGVVVGNTRYVQGQSVSGKRGTTVGDLVNTYDRSARMTRRTSDPMGYSTKRGVHGGSNMLPDEYAQAVAAMNERRALRQTSSPSRTPVTDIARNDTGLPGTNTGGQTGQIPTPTAGTVGQTTQLPVDPVTAQQAAAKSIYGTLQNLTFLDPQFKSMLGNGQIPGIGMINAGQWKLIRPDVQAALMGLWLSSGQASDENEVLAALNAGRPRGF